MHVNAGAVRAIDAACASVVRLSAKQCMLQARAFVRAHGLADPGRQGRQRLEAGRTLHGQMQAKAAQPQGCGGEFGGDQVSRPGNARSSSARCLRRPTSPRAVLAAWRCRGSWRLAPLRPAPAARHRPCCASSQDMPRAAVASSTCAKLRWPSNKRKAERWRSERAPWRSLNACCPARSLEQNHACPLLCIASRRSSAAKVSVCHVCFNCEPGGVAPIAPAQVIARPESPRPPCLAA